MRRYFCGGNLCAAACVLFLICECSVRAASGPVVTAMSPVPGSVLASAPSSVLLTFSSAIDPASVNTLTVQLVRAGPDGVFGTADDVAISPAAISVVNSNQIQIDLPANLPTDNYKVTLASRGTATNSGVNQVLSLDGTGQYVNLDFNASLAITNQLTAEAWFNFQSGGTQNPRILGRTDLVWEIFTWGTGSTRTIGTQITTDQGPFALQSIRSFAAGQWHHVAITYDQTTFRLYIDGALEVQSPATGQLAVTTYPLSVGKKAPQNGDYFKGQIDECRVWNVARTQAQIQATMSKALSGAESGLVVYWPFDEASGQTVTDLSPNHNDGTLGADANAGADDPSRVISPAPFFYAITDLGGNLLDGEPNASLPSGDGTAGGDFIAQFQVSLPSTSGLLAWYKLDDGSGTIASDASNNGNNGTLVNGPAWTTGIINGGLSFDGINDKVTLTDNLIHDNTTITITLWFKATTSGIMLGQQNPAGNSFVPNLYLGTDGKLRGEFWMGLVNPLASSGSVTDGTWHHVALTGAVNTQSLYLDGQLMGTLNGTIQQLDMSKNQLGIGTTGPWTGAGAAFFTGSLDDVRFYNRALSAPEIQALAYVPPVAANDSFGAATGQLATIAAPGVLSNDQSTFGTTLSAVLDTTVSHGTLSLNANGSFTYTASVGFSGTDSFTYHATDSLAGVSPSATVTLTVIDLGVTAILPNIGSFGQHLSNLMVNGNGFQMSTLLNPSGAVSFNGHNYLFVNSAMTWTNAKKYCIAQGGHLATISNATENQFVFNLGGQQSTWIGLTDEAVEGTFVSVTGEPVTYFNWNPGQPDNNFGGQPENYVDFYPGGGGTWNDARAALTVPFVCEFESVPTAVKLKMGALEIAATNVRLNSSSQLLCDFNLVGATIGTWDVVVTDVDTNASATLPGGFQINSAQTTTAAANIASLTYQTIAQHMPLNATVTPQFGTLNQGTVTFQLANGNGNVGSAVTSGTLVNGSTGAVDYPIPAGTAPGTYALTATFNGTNSYSGSFDNSKQLTINPATLTVTGTDASRLYGAVNPAFSGTLSGVQSGDGISATYASSATVLSSVGTYPIVPTLVDPNNKLSNYSVTSSNGTLTVTKASLTVAAFNAVRNYGDANPVLSGILLGIQNGDNILALYNTSATPLSPAGFYAITPALIDPDSKLGNYSVALSNGTLTVNAVAPIPPTPLTFTSPATATPASGSVGDVIHFSASPSDSSATISWNFGDGTTGIGNSVTHVFTAASTYSVTAVATLSAVTATSVVSVPISVLGSGQVSGTIKIMKLGIALKFADPQSALDLIAVKGTLATKQGFVPTGKRLVLSVGGILREFDLNAMGGGSSGTDTFTLSLKQKAGIVVAQNAKFSIQLTGNFKAALDQIGFKNADNKKPVSVPIETDISLDGTFYKVIRNEKYKSVLNVSGTAK